MTFPGAGDGGDSAEESAVLGSSLRVHPSLQLPVNIQEMEMLFDQVHQSRNRRSDEQFSPHTGCVEHNAARDRANKDEIVRS